VRSDETGTLFSIGWIPLGGYVQMLDEKAVSKSQDDIENAFQTKSPFSRLLIVLAGPFANMILAVLIFWAFFLSGEKTLEPIIGSPNPDSVAMEKGFEDGMRINRIGKTEIQSWKDINRTLFEYIGYNGDIQFWVKKNRSSDESIISVDVQSWLSEASEPMPARELGLNPKFNQEGIQIVKVEDGSAAKLSGLKEGDKIIRVNAYENPSLESFIKLVSENGNSDITITYIRDEIENTVVITPNIKINDDQQTGFLGVTLSPNVFYPEDMIKVIEHNIFSALSAAMSQTAETSGFIVSSLIKLLVGDISAKNLSGPIGIAKVAGDSAESGVLIFMRFIAVLSIMLGIMNLLPIPILDGGQAVYLLYEIFVGRPVPEGVQNFGMRFGVFVLLTLMVYATMNDITRFLF
jgi:regulator of sigma E protease